jgi:hypothetical protein
MVRAQSVQIPARNGRGPSGPGRRKIAGSVGHPPTPFADSERPWVAMTMISASFLLANSARESARFRKDRGIDFDAPSVFGLAENPFQIFFGIGLFSCPPSLAVRR